MKCECGQRLVLVDSRAVNEYARRRYICACGKRISSVEVFGVDSIPRLDFVLKLTPTQYLATKVIVSTIT